MAELTTADLALYTRGRIAENAEGAQDLLDAALAAARHYCGWHVSPVREETMTIDGSGVTVLGLPTKKLVVLTALSEGGQSVDVATLQVSTPGPFELRQCLVKKARGCWSADYGAIGVTMEHGFTETEAPDWRRAVLRLADSMDKDSSSARDDPTMTMKRVDDVEYQWEVAQALISDDERLAAILSAYRILPAP